MRLSSIGYTFRQGIKNIFRNKWFSLASVATMTACIFLFGLFYSIVTNFEYIVKEAEEGWRSLFFSDDGISQEQIDAIGRQILNGPRFLMSSTYRPRRPGKTIKRNISRTILSWRRAF